MILSAFKPEVTVTETEATYIVSCQPPTRWHCHRCKHILGVFEADGRCRPLHHDVYLSYDAPTVVVCPVCGEPNNWYSGYYQSCKVTCKST